MHLSEGEDVEREGGCWAEEGVYIRMGPGGSEMDC